MSEQRLIDELARVGEHLRESQRQQTIALEALAERQRLLRVTQEQRLRAERLAALGTLAATMAHELRNPLNVIRLTAHSISLHLPPDDRRLGRHIEHLNQAVDGACAIIDDLLAFAHLPPPSLQHVAVNDLARQAIAMLEVPGEVSVDWALTAGLPLVLADPRQVQQAIGNLGRNALQAMPAGGRLTISTRQAEDQVEITLRDTGPGIPEELRDRVCEPFFSTRVTGTGLGLPLVRSILAAHRGHFSLESKPGEGSSFTLSLPVTDSPAVGAMSGEPEPRPGPLAPRTGGEELALGHTDSHSAPTDR
jgi:signal transduction histidine kinase